MDFDKKHWAFDGMYSVFETQPMVGYPESFRPDASITRAELLSVLMRAYPQGPASGQPFADVAASHWAYAQIIQARGLGLVEGFNNRFRPDEPVTRAELAVMLQRFVRLREDVQGIRGCRRIRVGTRRDQLAERARPVCRLPGWDVRTRTQYDPGAARHAVLAAGAVAPQLHQGVRRQNQKVRKP